MNIGGRLAEWLKALVSKTSKVCGPRGFKSYIFRHMFRIVVILRRMWNVFWEVLHIQHINWHSSIQTDERGKVIRIVRTKGRF